MKTFKYLLVAAVAVPALAGPGFAQTSKPAAPPAAPAAAPAVTPAVTQDAAKVAGKSLAGELVSVDQAAKTVTVKHMVDSKPMQLTMSVEDTAIATLAQLKPGDQVKVTYVEMGGKRIVKSIVKG
jgi:Cu/Ag efflux protein CusF